MQPLGSCPAPPAAAGVLEKPQTTSFVRKGWSKVQNPPGEPASPTIPSPRCRWCPHFKDGTFLTSDKPSAKQDVRAVTAAGVGSARVWEGSSNNKGGFSEQQPPLSGCSRGSGPVGASASCPHGMPAKARALRLAQKDEERQERGRGRERKNSPLFHFHQGSIQPSKKFNVIF